MSKKRSKQTFWSMLILLSSILLAFVMIISKRAAQKTQTETPPTTVETIIAKKTDEHLIVSAFGTVQPNRRLNVRPEVSGIVIDHSDNLVVGGVLKKGETILQIDPRNYEYIVEQEKADVKNAEFELQVEMGKQIVAEREWTLLNPSIDIATDIGKELALRRPHLREKQAALLAAKSRLNKALLDLKRTKIQAPFNAVVIQEAIEKGEYVSPQSIVATIVATDAFRIQVSLPYNQLSWIQLPGQGQPGSEVTIIQEVGRGKTVKREGKLLRLLSDTEPTSRMARLLIEVADPLGLNTPKHRSHPLLLGTYVRVEIKGSLLKDVFVIPPEALHEGNKVWVKAEDNTLAIHPVEVILIQEDRIILADGLKEGEEIVLTNLPLAIPGTRLKTL